MLLCWEGAAASLSGLWGWAAGRGGSAGPGPGCRWGWSSLASQCCRQLSSQLQAKARSEPVVLPANRCCVSNVPSLQKHRAECNSVGPVEYGPPPHRSRGYSVLAHSMWVQAGSWVRALLIPPNTRRTHCTKSRTTSLVCRAGASLPSPHATFSTQLTS